VVAGGGVDPTAVLALREGVIPPTLNLRNLDPEIDLDVVAGEPRPGGMTATRSTIRSDSAGTTSRSRSANTSVRKETQVTTMAPK
jgi:hypothetical protein